MKNPRFTQRVPYSQRNMPQQEACAQEQSVFKKEQPTKEEQLMQYLKLKEIENWIDEVEEAKKTACAQAAKVTVMHSNKLTLEQANKALPFNHHSHFMQTKK
ncbi:MAG TPA: hypothetical protein VLG50_04460 [Candidatus Saccharimonadales bacterium]|nr:hypothetical protein [Candidatus Saccharimonadales bacterium]